MMCQTKCSLGYEVVDQDRNCVPAFLH